ncbi:hypothetical protein [Kitasatospora sp. NPDC059571]|uniref:hypothetical protein n=1 Tax=Kitasatospora sp. NPDC059571 TaxID=3346871 RepID=UPI0036874C52
MIGRDGPVVVEIEDVTAEAVFARLPDALAAVWQALRALPLGAVQADAFEYFLTRPDAVRAVARFLRRDGELSLTFTLEGRPHAVRIRPADGAAPAAGALERSWSGA